MEVKSTIPDVATLRLFGSYARGEETEFSDYDVLVVLNQSQVINTDLEERIRLLFDREISISWYSKQRIELLFKMGHLFAWHLYLESKTFDDRLDFINHLGVPKKYKYSYQDVWSLLEILKPIRSEILSHPKNLVYEMGIVYVCARNIAICASPKLSNKYTFNVKAPFDLNIGISHTDFELLINCRYASSRGLPSPHLTTDYCLDLYEKVWNWGTDLLEVVKK
jgi:predicted nucleotidyltransferase